MTNVPDLNGKTEEEAKTLAKEAGSKVKVEVGTDESKADGLVIFQDKEANSEVEKDSYITITINSLPTEKLGNIIVNVKSLLERKGKATINEDGTPKMVKVEVIVAGNSVLTQENVNANEITSLGVPFKGKGWIDIEVLIDDVRYTEDGYGKYLEDYTGSEINITIN